MRKGTVTPLLALGLPLLLAGCGQSPTSDAADPYANGVSYPWSYPWSYVAPEGQLTAQRLTPGDNNLYFEPILAARNSWGPIEINRSNGEREAGDGKTLTLNGKTYEKGYGTHAGSEMRFSLGGTNGAQCTRFTADVGVDDEVGSRGSVVFQVFLDNVKVYDSGKMTGASATKKVDLDVRGTRELRLIVTDAGDGISYDHADWARPMIFCEEPGDIDLYNYLFQFDPGSVSGAVGETVTATLIVTDASSTGTLGPVSFKLELRDASYRGLKLAEPQKLYAATTLPARFPARLRLDRADEEGLPPLGPGSRIIAEFRPTLEGFADPLNRLADLSWNVTDGTSSGQNVWDSAAWDQATWQ